MLFQVVSRNVPQSAQKKDEPGKPSDEWDPFCNPGQKESGHEGPEKKTDLNFQPMKSGLLPISGLLRYGFVNGYRCSGCLKRKHWIRTGSLDCCCMDRACIGNTLYGNVFI